MSTHSTKVSHEELPVPGVVLGIYPERRGKQATSRHSSAAASLGGLLAPFRRRADWQSFTRETLARRAILEPISDDSFALIVDVTRRLLRAEGFAQGPLVEAMACVCEASRRALGMVPFDTQLIAARLMLDNQLAEMATGEGKTLASAMTAAVAAMAGVPVHCITANDYLVTRDASTMKPLYEMLGVSVGTVTQADDPGARRLAYECDVTYCSAKELVFDYLKGVVQLGDSKHDLLHRVNALSPRETGWQQPYLRGLCMAIVDEADSVLIDEAGVPLVLARARSNASGADHLRQALRIARNLQPQRHFQSLGEEVELTEQTRALLSNLARNLPALWHDARVREELILQALSALHVHQRDRHYIVQNGKVCIVDQNTGRIAQGRAWSRGLHQLIELKEGCYVTAAQDTIAQITYQRFFPRYIRLAGTSGTLQEARSELMAQYRLPVQQVPLRSPNQRTDLGLRVYYAHANKWQQVIARVLEMRQCGRPVLIGTDSVAESEQLARLLRDQGIEHSALNARQDYEEAAIVARAGLRGAVTVATNMAGRGTDIVLEEGVAELGGLHVICCQLNCEARIDRQLYGRSARQGDPGTFETILCLKEPVLKRWVPTGMQKLAAVLCTPQRRIPLPIALALVRASQWLEQRVRRAQRKALARRDALENRRLSLSGARE